MSSGEDLLDAVEGHDGSEKLVPKDSEPSKGAYKIGGGPVYLGSQGLCLSVSVPMDLERTPRTTGLKRADRVDVGLMALGFIGAVADGFCARMTLVFISRMLNNIGSSASTSKNPDNLRHSLNKNAVALLYLASALWFACFLEAYCWARTGERQASRMRVIYLKAVLRQDVGYFDLDVSTTNEVITTISSDSLAIQDAISEKVPDFVRRVAGFVGAYTVAIIMLWKLAILGIPMALLLVITGCFCGRSLTHLAAKIRGEYSRAGSIAEQAISSIRMVYAFGGERKTLAEFSATLNGATKLGLRQGLVTGFAVGSKGLVFAIWSAMAYYGSRLVMYHGAHGGNIYAVGNSIVIGAMELGAALSHIKDFSEVSIACKRINEMIKRVPKIDSDNLEGKILEDLSGVVEFKNVKFAYPSRPESVICKDLCLTILARKSVALVGASGSGKSTVLSLLQRFYDPMDGKILLDGVAIDKLQLNWLRSQMALVSQEPSLFSTTIKENILFGKEDATMEDVVEAANAGNAHNFICELPQGYDSQVGERGIQLSGGQKQRIAIARAIIRKPRILLLDEATSALDYESERIVQEALDKVAMDRTTVMIAHRLSTIKNADTIVVLKDGQVMETGSHDELIKQQNGLYNSLIHLQHMHSAPLSTLDTDFDKSNSISLSEVGQSSFTNSSEFNQACLDKLENSKVSTLSFWRLLALNKPEWKQATMGCLSAILFGAVQPVYAFSLGAMVSVYFLTDYDDVKQKTRTYALCFLGLSVFSILINISQHFSFAYMGEYLTKRVKEMILTKVLTYEVGWFDKNGNSSAIICSKLSKDANMVRSLVGDRMSLLLHSFAAVTIAWTMSLVIAWRLALIIIATQPLVIACIYARRVLLKTLSMKAIKAQDESCKLAAEAVSNLRTITTFSSQNRILKMLEDAQNGPRRESMRQSWFAGFGLAFAQSISYAIVSLNYWYGGKLASKGYITARQVFQTVLILLTTARVIADAGSITSNIAQGFDAIASLFVILDRDTRIDPEKPESNEPELMIKGHIELHNVYFAYPTRPKVMIFQGFSINIEARKSTAIVGKSGSGKSTIIGLIERFYDPQEGAVKIDGQDIRSYNLRSLRKHIALVSQEPTLFAGTIRENITYGASKSIGETEMVEAAKVANVHGFITGLKDGYETQCGDKGIQLSGGQKQRIAIARAVLRNPAVLLLDEATSALDSPSEKLVQDALECMMVGRTSVVVAHRLNTIQKCDMIFVLDKGKVVENGTHFSLMAKGSSGAYCSMLSIQKS
ncbi:hypothetical protein FNV43_RR02727 [Rhamnella rubrinervis]|uniref:ABC transporter B family member 15-like n=1 Tax=Rhamnella rubrinervis TaxID=2594499 RepID=A0A8K0HIE7_9ROSA|nr:hypothetical protein FNV43_RR02727 [Rhamnella rubrinervis]